MYPTKYVVYRQWSGDEVFWNGSLVRGKTMTTRTDQASTFDSAEEAYATIGVLVARGFLPKAWLDARVGLRYIADEDVIDKDSCGFRGECNTFNHNWGGLRKESTQ